MERVSEGYFNTFGIPILRGRAIEARDAAGAPVAAVINQLNAAKYFGGEKSDRHALLRTAGDQEEIFMFPESSLPSRKDSLLGRTPGLTPWGETDKF